ncbi:YfiR family protein [Oryzisolibacter sp. LB2S]|uniref:YfiR family protein n=1 Tax=Alicycliphilus soli TaxID=3228789 RepID=UPI003457CAB5
MVIFARFLPTWVGGRQAAALAALCALWLTGAPLRAQEIVTDERSQAVAQTVLGILGYTRWPSASPVVRLCVVGPTEYADELLKGGTLPGERSVQVRRMRLDDAELLQLCDGIYAGMLDDAAWRELRARLEAQPLLSISERQELCLIGCMFCLDVRAGGVTFETNLDSVARSGVRVNPRVLQLARRKGST